MKEIHQDIDSANDGDIFVIWDEHHLISTKVRRGHTGIESYVDGRKIKDIIRGMNDPQVKIFGSSKNGS